MKTLQDIKNNYAQEQGHGDWVVLQSVCYGKSEYMEAHMDEICLRAQKEVLENAAKNAKFGYGIGGVGSSTQYIIDRSSIINEQNLIR